MAVRFTRLPVCVSFLLAVMSSAFEKKREIVRRSSLVMARNDNLVQATLVEQAEKKQHLQLLSAKDEVSTTLGISALFVNVFLGF